jgi:integrase
MAGSRSRKRKHGEGSIVKLPNGRFQVRVSYWEGGRLRRLARYAKTAAEATRLLSDLRRQAHTGALPPGISPGGGWPAPGPARPGAMTVQELCRLVLDGERGRLRPRTWVRYEQIVRLQVVPHLGRMRLRQLHPAQVQAWLTTLQATGLATRSVEQAHAVLRRVLAIGERWGLVDQNVARKVSPPHPRRPEVEPFTPDELARVLAALSDDPPGPVGAVLATLAYVAAGTGLRLGELLGLRWADVDLAQGRLAVRGQLQRLAGRWLWSEPKSTRARRLLHLPAGVQAALAAQQRRIAAWRAGPVWDPAPALAQTAPDDDRTRQALADLVFCTPEGRPLHGTAVAAHWRRACAAAGVRSRSFHTLRHTAASWLLAAGADLRLVQGVLGHAQISLTADLYTHLVPQTLSDAAQRLHTFLPPAPPGPSDPCADPGSPPP